MEKTNNVIIQGKMSPSFERVVGLRQDDALPTLFIYSMYGGYKECEGTTIFHRTRQCLLCADDVVLLGCAVKHTGETI